LLSFVNNFHSVWLKKASNSFCLEKLLSKKVINSSLRLKCLCICKTSVPNLPYSLNKHSFLPWQKIHFHNFKGFWLIFFIQNISILIHNYLCFHFLLELFLFVSNEDVSFFFSEGSLALQLSFCHDHEFTSDFCYSYICCCSWCCRWEWHLFPGRLQLHTRRKKWKVKSSRLQMSRQAGTTFSLTQHSSFPIHNFDAWTNRF